MLLHGCILQTDSCKIEAYIDSLLRRGITWLTNLRRSVHSGGKITFRIVTDQQGRRGFQVTISSNRPVPAAWIAVYALPQGVAVESIQLGGIGQPWNPPPHSRVAFRYSSPRTARANLGTIARTAADTGVVALGPTSALIALSGLPVFNSFRELNSAMCANTARC